jgi:hypothetical protein
MSDRPEHVSALVREASRLADPEERRAYLDRACGDDRDLRAAVERALAHEAPTSTGGSFPSFPDAEQTALSSDVAGSDAMAEQPGSVLGPYRLVKVLGEGGFGTVFLAEQEGRSAARWRSRSSSWAWTRAGSSARFDMGGRRSP